MLQTILVLLADHSLWQSVNEGFSWSPLFPDETFLVFYHHKYSHDRAYAITTSNKYFYTTNTGRAWHEGTAPTGPNSFGQPVLHFHPTSDYLIWTGDQGCTGSGNECHAEAHYSTDNGRNWKLIDTYVKNCAWAEDAMIFVDPSEIICESYRDKRGTQRLFQLDNPLELVIGTTFYTQKRKLFEHVVGFAKFSQYLIVAEV
jgi:Sortilin, neurotensin receptor 3,